MANQLKTYGDLKRAIKLIILKQKGEKIGSVALDQIINLIPGASAAKTTFDFIKAAMSKPDTQKTGTWLDKLDIDDETSAIVDDTVEAGFMKALSASIDSMSDDQPLEGDFNMNQKLVDYLKSTYKGRTITGIHEFISDMKKHQLTRFLREELNITPETSNNTLKGSFNTQIIKDLGIDVSKFNVTMNLVKQNKVLNNAANKILADLFIKIIKSDDTVLQNKVFTAIKQFKSQ